MDRIETLLHLKKAEALTAEDRDHAVGMGMLYMQHYLNNGGKYGVTGEPNMQSLIEMLCMPLDELNSPAVRASLNEFIDRKLLPLELSYAGINAPRYDRRRIPFRMGAFDWFMLGVTVMGVLVDPRFRALVARLRMPRVPA